MMLHITDFVERQQQVNNFILKYILYMRYPSIAGSLAIHINIIRMSIKSTCMFSVKKDGMKE